MKEIEAMIYCPLGDKASLQADYGEADRIRREMIGWLERADEIRPVTVVSLEKLSGASWFHYLRYSILTMGGHLIKLEKLIV